MKLLPPAPFVMNPKRHRAKRRLYPEDYVTELGRITARYPGARLERESWKAFQKDAYDAYNRLVMPLLGGVIPVEVEVLGGGTWDNHDDPSVSSTTTAEIPRSFRSQLATPDSQV